MEVDLDNIDGLYSVRHDLSELSKRSRFLFMRHIEEDSGTDDDYLNFLQSSIENSVNESEEYEDLDDNYLSDEDLNANDHVVNSDENLENVDSDEDDPLYKLFLSSVKSDGKSFTFETKDENGNLKTIEYHKEDPVDGWHSPNMKRNINNVVESKRKRISTEQRKSKYVKRSLSPEKSNITSSKHTSRNQSVSRPQPKSIKDGLGKVGVEQLKTPLSVGRNTIKIEQKSSHEKDYKRFLTSAEVMYNRINLPLKSGKRIIYDEEVDFDAVLCHDVKSVRHKYSENNNVDGDDTCQILGSSLETDQLKEKVMVDLRKPFDAKEYKTLWNVITQKHNISRSIQLRFGRDKSVPTDAIGKSYLEQHEAFRREIEAVPHDKYKRLNLLRGFFFWLKHVPWGSTFKPWEEDACLAVMPGSR